MTKQQDMLNEGLIHTLQGMTERSGLRFHHASQHDPQFKTYELFISGIFRLQFFEPR